MSDIIGGENHFPLGFGSTDRTFDLDFGAGDSTFGLDFGSAIIGGSSLPDGGEAGQVLTKVSDDDGDAEWRSPAPTFPPMRFDFWVAKDQNGDLYIVNGPSPSTVIEESRSGAARVQQAVLYFDENGNHEIFLQLAEARWQKEGMLLPEIMFVGINKTNGDIITLSAFSGTRQWTLKTTNPAAYALEEALEAVSAAEETFSETVGPLGDLETETTDNLVAAINEVNEKASSGADLSAYRTAAAQDVIDQTQDTAIAAKYTKPSTGIPKTDLASDVQTSLGKADTALQQHQSLSAYRTAADQDTIDAAQDTAIAGKLPTTGDAYRTASIPMGHLDSTSTATVMTATVPGITELRDGVCVWLRNGVVSSASGVTLNINGLGAKPLYSSLAAASRSTTIFSSSYTLLLIFNSTRVDGGCWDVVYGIDTNTNTIGYQIRTNSTTMPMASIVYRYRLLFTSADGKHLVPANNSSSTNATSSRTVCQTPIDPFGTIYYYGATASVAANANPAVANLWTRYVITLGYSFNRTGAALALTPNVPVYIKAAPQTDGSAIIDADTPYVQLLPTTEDGKIYIFLGVAAAATTVEIQENHPVYCYRNGSIRKWTGLEAELDALIPASGVSF